MLFVMSAALATLFLGYVSSVCAAENAPTNPLYAAYQFDKSGKTIHFASQPLATPEGVIATVMQRDRILQKRLNAKGLKIRFYPFLKGADINEFMRRGEIDITMAGEGPSLSAAATFRIAILALAKQGASSIVARGNLPALDDLKGKRIAYPAGSTANIGLLIALSTVGMDERSVKLVPMEITQLTTALVSGQVDAFSAWEPTPSIALEEHRHLRTVSKFLNTGYLYANGSFLERNSFAAEEVLASYVRAVRWLRESDHNLTLAAKWSIQTADTFLGKASGRRVATVKRITMQDLLRFGDPVLTVGDFAQNGYLSRTFQFLQSRGMIDAAVSWETVQKSLSNVPMKKILAAPRQYQLNLFSYEAK
mgnify:CR=1 FL=1